jgi:hypothetical protein
MNQRVSMSKEICHKYSDLLGKCNFTIAVKSCSNYQFRLGGERNTEIVTTGKKNVQKQYTWYNNVFDNFYII